jgi:hypothetical protein
MTLRLAPPAATALLKLFCPGPDYDSVIGDLTEQYQLGHSPWWYWKQVLAIVVVGNYRRAVQRPLVSTSRPPVGQVFALLVVIVAVLSMLLSEIWWMIFLPAIIGGFVIAGVIVMRGCGHAEPTPLNAPGVARIDSSKIPIGGGIGAGILIVILLGGLLLDLPQMRALAIPGILSGLLFGVALHLWRRSHVPAPRVETLGLKRNAMRDVGNPHKRA